MSKYLITCLLIFTASLSPLFADAQVAVVYSPQKQVIPSPQPSKQQIAPLSPTPQLVDVRVLVLPGQETVLSSSVFAKIEKIHFGIGQVFTKNAVLVTLNCTESNARLTMSHAELAAAEDQYEAKLRMMGLDQASEVEVSLAAHTVEKHRAERDLHQHQVSQCVIRAPWSGRISRVHVKDHMTIAAGQPLVELVGSGVLKIKFNAPSSQIGRVTSARLLTVQIDETNKSYQARIRQLNSRVDPVSQTVEMEASFTQSHPELLPGMSGTVQY